MRDRRKRHVRLLREGRSQRRRPARCQRLDERCGQRRGRGGCSSSAAFLGFGGPSSSSSRIRPRCTSGSPSEDSEDDCAGPRHLLRRPGMGPGLQLVDAVAKGLQLLGHGGVVLAFLVVLRFEKLVMLGLKALQLGGFVFGQRHVLGEATTEAAPLAVAEARRASAQLQPSARTVSAMARAYPSPASRAAPRPAHSRCLPRRTGRGAPGLRQPRKRPGR